MSNSRLNSKTSLRDRPFTPRSEGRRHARFILHTLALAGLWFAPLASWAQVQNTADGQAEERFEASERVTAIDLLVEVYPKLFEGIVDPTWDRLPKELVPEDFRIEDRSEARTPIALAASTDEPWRVVVWVDQHLSSTASIRRGATILASHAQELAALGTVEMVAATPRLRSRLAPTEDAELIDSTLSHLAISGEGEDRLRGLRAEYLRATEDEDLDATRSELQAAYAAEETRLIQNGFDDLLLRLLDVGTPRDGKVLFLLTDGFDLDPDVFYRADAKEELSPEGEVPKLAESYREFLRTVASYGWVVVPIHAPLVYRYPDSIGPRKALLMKIDRNRNVTRAEALLDLAQTQLASEEWAKAEKTLGQAIHRFYDHPKTRKRQATAETLLADALDGQARYDESEAALRRAVALDPSVATTHRGATAAIVDPEAPLTEIAMATTGKVAVETETLSEIVGDLSRRIRLTYQVPGQPDGGLHPVSIAIDRPGYGARSAAWVRSSTPPGVAAARVRARLRDFESQHDDTLDAELASTHGELTVRVQIPQFESELPSGPYRVSVGLGGEAMLPSVHHSLAEADNSTVELRVDQPEEAQWISVIVEDLGTGERRELFTAVP